MRTFFILWSGQIISLLGSRLTEFALGVWLYQQTESATQFALIFLLIYGPGALISPIAGTLVDRWDRRWAMMLSDTVGGLTTLSVLILVLSNQLVPWHIYGAVIIISTFNALQVPAYTSAIAQIVPPDRQSRANGLGQLSRAIAKIMAPLMAGIVVKHFGLSTVLIFDVATFFISIGTLASIRLPQVRRAKTYFVKISKIWSDIWSSWRYIAARPGLVRLLSYVSVSYFSFAILEILVWLYVLGASASSEALGLILTVGGLGMVLGSVTISAWGGPNRRVYGILAFVFLQGIFAAFCGFNASVFVVAIGIFGYLFAQPIIISCNQAIWQRKVPPKLQGRIFSLQQMLENSLAIIARALTGPLLDYVLKPLMAPGSWLANSAVGQMVGLGPNAHITMLFILMGAMNIVATVIAYRSPRLRLVESDLPNTDHLLPNFPQPDRIKV